MKKTFLLLLLLPMALCVKGQTTVTLNLPNPCSSVGVDNPGKGEMFDFSVFPNPAGGNQLKLSIKANEQIGTVVIEIFNAQGTLVYKEEIFSENQTAIKTINTGNLSGGLYMISGRERKTGKQKTLLFIKTD